MTAVKKYSVVRCPVCGCRGKVLLDVDEDGKITCNHCKTRIKATKWTECNLQPLQPTEEERLVRKEIESMVSCIKRLAGAINMPMEDVIRMVRE